MRIWDIDPGFLNDRSLLAEHRELHGIHSIISNGKSGYARHPETLRWAAHLSALTIRHGLLVEEMKLRKFKHLSPLSGVINDLQWPPIFIDRPANQYSLLEGKYADKPRGRIPLPGNIQELWAAHKYSVMAREPAFCKSLGRQVATGAIDFEVLAEKMVLILRTQPGAGRLTNAVAHMWGYVADYSGADPQKLTNTELLQEIQNKSSQVNIDYLLRSTALAELKYWCGLAEMKKDLVEIKHESKRMSGEAAHK